MHFARASEVRADLVLALGPSLCDTPSTADRLVVASARRAAAGHGVGSVRASPRNQGCKCAK